VSARTRRPRRGRHQRGDQRRRGDGRAGADAAGGERSLDGLPASTYAYIAAQDNSQNFGYQQLASVVIQVSLAIDGCTLAAGIGAGLAERKRPFSVLQLTGARLSTLRGVVALEGAVPLLAVAVVAVGTGFVGAEM